METELVCQICGRPFVSQGMHCRVSTYDNAGNRREEGLSCGAKRERAEKLLTVPNSTSSEPVLDLVDGTNVEPEE